jgi:dCTP deaminase
MTQTGSANLNTWHRPVHTAPPTPSPTPSSVAPVHRCAYASHLRSQVGELRAHYAGFFDPGFGYGRAGEVCGTIGVLEVRPHETITIYDGQPICMMEFFRNVAPPAAPYGFSGNNYAGQQGPKLAKYFAQ